MPVTARAVCSKIHVLKPSYKCTGRLQAEELRKVCTLRWTAGCTGLGSYIVCILGCLALHAGAVVALPLSSKMACLTA